MSKRTFRGDSSSEAHKRQAAAPHDEEGPLLQLASASSSLVQQASSLPIPKMPLHLIAELILPLVASRTTWNSACSASKELRLAAKKMTPPWPNKAFSLGSNVQVPHLAFSPSGSQLAFGTKNDCDADQHVIHALDRWGKATLLGGHTGCVCCMERSFDGEHLASGSSDGSIRIWHAESCRHAISSQTHRETSG
jgi:hypothetical protein